MSPEELRAQAEAFLSRPPPPASQLRHLDRSLLPALSWAALSHPNPAARRLSLDYLDHLAGAAEVTVLIAALRDPVPRVRRHAVHALSCEPCKDEPLCADVITPLREVATSDPSPRVRFEALRALHHLLPTERAVAEVTAAISRHDLALLREAARARPRAVPPTLREAAQSALAGPPDR